MALWWGVSIRKQVSDLFPALVKVIAEDGGANGNEIFGSLSGLTHACATKTIFILLSTAFDHAAPNRPAIFT
jgi:hypothetical protein